METKGSGSGAESSAVDQRLLHLGAAVRVLGGSARHLGYTIADLAVYVATPIQLDQFLIFRRRNTPIAYIAWAFLSDEVGQAYASGTYELTARDWRCGDQMWFVEFVAPFGDAPRIAQGLRHGVFRDRHARSVRLYADGERRVVDWYGEDRLPTARAMAEAASRCGASQCDRVN